MRYIKQSNSLKLPNIYSEQKKTYSRHGKLLPKTIRCIICGPSNCGKTNLMVGLLIHKDGLRYSNVYLYSKTLFQPKYTFLEQVLKKSGVYLKKFSDNKDVLSPLKVKSNAIIVFDDVACDNQNNIRKYFAMGRHKYVDCFYLNQTYSKIPKQLVRDNANLLILFKQDDINLRHIYDEHVNSDMTWSTFRTMCSTIWNTKSHSYVVINKDCKKNEGCYRKEFDTFIVFD